MTTTNALLLWDHCGSVVFPCDPEALLWVRQSAAAQGNGVNMERWIRPRPYSPATTTEQDEEFLSLDVHYLTWITHPYFPSCCWPSYDIVTNMQGSLLSQLSKHVQGTLCSDGG